jgi:hypothetical protein
MNASRIFSPVGRVGKTLLQSVGEERIKKAISNSIKSEDPLNYTNWVSNHPSSKITPANLNKLKRSQTAGKRRNNKRKRITKKKRKMKMKRITRKINYIR